MPSTPTYTLINQITLGASASTITFSSIPQNYRDLVLVVNGSVAVQYRLNPNGDSGNASLVYMDGYGSSTAAGTDSKISLWFNSSGGPVTSINQIIDYSAIDKHKMVLTRGSASGTAVSAYASRWASTAAITRLDIVNAASPGDLPSGSTISLYGIVG